MKTVNKRFVQCKRHILLTMPAALLSLTPVFIVSRAIGSTNAFSTIHEFDGTDGREPYSSVHLAPNGYLYGTTVRGGDERAGTIFKCLPNGESFSTLHTFSTQTGPWRPFSGLSFDSNFAYGVAQNGGTNNTGAIFKISLSTGTYETLASFKTAPGPAYPYIAPTLHDGILYGTTFSGGDDNVGAAYSYNLQTNQFKTLHSFTLTSSSRPFSQLTPVNDWLYGMTSDHMKTDKAGSIFRLKADGSAFETLHSFEGTGGNGYPYDSLTYDGSNTLYGTTLGFYTDTTDEGTLFSYDISSGTLSTLHNFNDTTGDGAKPNGSLLLSDDNEYLYGLTHGSEAWEGPEHGTAFRIKTDGTSFQKLHTFTGLAQGDTPMRTPVLLDGRLIGTTAYGGTTQVDLARGYGTVWSLAVPEPSQEIILFSFALVLCFLRCLKLVSLGKTLFRPVSA